MRKLPSDHDVAMLRSCGWTVKEICARYGVRSVSVYDALKRWKGQEASHHKTKALHVDRSFVRAGSQATTHRDTGEGIGFGQIRGVGRLYRTSLDDCRDLLREWGVQ